MILEIDYKAIKKCVISDFPYDIEWNDSLIKPIFSDVYNLLLEEHAHIDNVYYSKTGCGIINLGFLDHYAIIAYRFSRLLWLKGMTELADAVYYSLRVRCSIDLYYKADIGPYFIPTHSLGTCIDAHAKYGKMFRIYNGCHIGPYNIVGLAPKDWMHPVFGDNVTLLRGSQVYGKTIIGNNVILSINTVVINEDIPDNCIVSGVSPNLYFKKLKTINSFIKDSL